MIAPAWTRDAARHSEERHAGTVSAIARESLTTARACYGAIATR
ncbi:MAG TPA: hypothetical protein VFB46_05165 [Gemmatimonadaceae bacterium]|nr:hypothetical protein [Gemmatimonadaceae bacterium]